MTRSTLVFGLAGPVLLALALGAVAAVHLRPLVELDGVMGVLDSAFLWEDTEYAPGYTHRRFAEVEVGMTETQLVELLGPPLEMLPLESGDEAWLYSRPGSDTHYHVRVVHLAAHRVARRISEFYVD